MSPAADRPPDPPPGRSPERSPERSSPHPPADPAGEVAPDPLAWLGLGLVGLGASLAPLDFALNVAFPAMTEALRLQTQDIRWAAISYVLTYGSLMLAFGALGDRVGHLRVYGWGLVVCVLALAGCALAPSFGWLLAGRVLQGLGVALVLSCAPALALALFDEARRTRVLSAHNGLAAAFGVAAPVAGGWTLAAMGWPGVFWFRVPLELLALAGLPLLARGLRQQRRRAFAARGPLAGAIGAGHRDPLLPHRPAAAPAPAWWSLAVWRRPGFAALNGVSVLLQAGTFALPLVVPYYLARQGAWAPLAMGGLMALWALGIVLVSTVAARVIAALGPRRAALLGIALATLALAGIACWPASPLRALMAGCLLLQGVGLGLFQVAYADQVVAALPVSQRGVAGSLTMVTRTAGIVAGALVWLPLLQAAGQGQFMPGHRWVFGTAAGLGLLAIALLLRSVPLLPAAAASPAGAAGGISSRR